KPSTSVNSLAVQLFPSCTMLHQAIEPLIVMLMLTTTSLAASSSSSTTSFLKPNPPFDQVCMMGKFQGSIVLLSSARMVYTVPDHLLYNRRQSLAIATATPLTTKYALFSSYANATLLHGVVLHRGHLSLIYCDLIVDTTTD